MAEKDKGKIVLDNFIIPASHLEETQGKVFPTILSLDMGLSGGIPEGVNVLLSGKAKIGKTSLALHYAQNCQRIDKDKKVFFFDVEGRLRTQLLDCFPFIDKERFNIIRSNENRILTAEDYLNLIFETLKDYPKCIVILDSIAALCPESELSTNIGDSVKMASIASLMYKMLRKSSQILSVTQSTLIVLTHMIANPSPGMGKRTFSVGGNAVQYGASVWLEGIYKERIEDKSKNTIGHLAHFAVLASALGAPGMEVCIPIIFGKGLDTTTDLFNIATDIGMIEQKGAWYTYLETQEKFQGKDNVIKYMNENPKVVKELEEKIRSISLPEHSNESKISKSSA